MKLFRCPACGQVLYFENTRCERCRRLLGYVPERVELAAVEPEGDVWKSLSPKGGLFRFCDNAKSDVCNWLIPTESGARFCIACQHNRTIPDLSLEANLGRWRKLELAKHRLFYTLLRLRLPLATRTDDPEHGLTFDFLADTNKPGGRKVLTGHDNGIITISLREADDAERERMRLQMGEPYRTLLGHFRHEVGHHFWDLLVRDGDLAVLEQFRAMFGDEREDYDAALQRHYRDGAPADWQERFISAYATTHPWEDFAETWAHYLHMLDTLEMARAFGMSVRPRVTDDPALEAELDFDPHAAADAAQLVDAWLPLCFAVNSLNRSIGQPDLYPFVLSPPVIEKLGFIHRVVQETGIEVAASGRQEGLPPAASMPAEQQQA